MRPASRAFAEHSGLDRENDTVRVPPGSTAARNNDVEPRSSFGTVPGAELPPFVYISVLAAYAWIMLVSVVAFARDWDAGLSLGVAIVLGLVFFALPIIIRHVAKAFSHAKPETPHQFLGAPVETATGPLSGASAWLQVLIIPLSLALAATLIGLAFLLVR
jgi:hypothetical protein